MGLHMVWCWVDCRGSFSSCLPLHNHVSLARAQGKHRNPRCPALITVHCGAHAGGLGANAQLSAPTAVAVDVMGSLYILEANASRVRILSTPSGVLTTVSAVLDGVQGKPTLQIATGGGQHDTCGVQPPCGACCEAITGWRGWICHLRLLRRPASPHVFPSPHPSLLPSPHSSPPPLHPTPHPCLP